MAFRGGGLTLSGLAKGRPASSFVLKVQNGLDRLLHTPVEQNAL